MTIREFSKEVTFDTLFEKYFWYLLYTATTIAGLYLLYDVYANPAKYDRHGTTNFAYFAYSLIVLLGGLSVYLVPNRYKTLSIGSNLAIEEKKEVVSRLLKEFGEPFCYPEKDIYHFTYRKKWWSSVYDIYLGISSDAFYLSVQSKVGGYYGGGIIDFGHTEKIRSKIIVVINRLTASIT
jgi:hypothetical protein